MTDGPALDNERAMLAAELALGLLDGEARAEALRLQLADREFAAMVSRWNGEVAEWLNELAPEDPTAEPWQRIERALRPDEPALAAVPASSGTGWKWATMAASLAAVGFASLWALQDRRDPVAAPGPVVAAAPTAVEAETLAVGDLHVGRTDVAEDKLLIQAAYDSRTGVLLLRLGDIGSSTQVPELWLVTDAAPRSLGIFQPGTAVKTTLTPRDREALEKGAVLAVSLEAPSDKPHDKPAGPILGKVALSAI